MPCHGILEHQNFKLFSREEYPKTLLQARTLTTLESMPLEPNHLHLPHNLFQQNILRRLCCIGKHVLSFYQVIETRVEVGTMRNAMGTWAIGKCFHSFLEYSWTLRCFYDSIETWRTCFLFLLKNTAKNTLVFLEVTLFKNYLWYYIKL